MGGLYVLLAVATMGVTYGWQPDGNGGVEYLVQVSPDQLDQVRESGQISSAIDPAVQGHVSRVVIRVGNKPLPRELPPELVAANQRRGQHGDFDTVAVPSITARHPKTSTTVLKPDPQGEGMGLPDSIARGAGNLARGAATGAQNLLRDAGSATNDAARRLGSQATDAAARGAQRMRDAGMSAANNAGSELMNRGSSAMSNARGALAQGAEDLLRRQQNAAAPRVANSAQTRDKTWYEEGDVPSMKRAGLADNQRPELVGPPDLRNRQANQSRAGNNMNMAGNRSSSNATSTTRDGGLGSTSTFGSMPKGMALPGDRDDRSSRLGFDPSRPTINDLRDSNSRTNGYRNERNTGMTAGARPAAVGDYPSTRQAGNRSMNELPSTADYRQTGFGGANNRDTRSALNERLGTGRSNASVGLERASAGIDARDLRRTNGYNTNEYSTPRSVGTTNTRPPLGQRPAETNIAASRLPAAPTLDPRLNAQSPIGVYARDAWGNPIDKYKRVLDEFGNPVSAQRAYEMTVGRNNPAFQTTPVSAPYTQLPVQRTSGIGYVPPRQATNDNRPKDETKSAGVSKGKTFATQALINFLLLISFFANIFLIGWMRNLLQRYRDIVATKRITPSSVGGVSV